MCVCVFVLHVTHYSLRGSRRLQLPTLYIWCEAVFLDPQIKQ
jgi:hypothetical protein